MVAMAGQDQHLLRLAIAISRRSRQNGNHPFGALLADTDGTVLCEAENTVVTSGDVTGHAETNLVRTATTTLAPEVLATSTLFASTEPCAMCAGAIYWSGIGRVVYALAETELRRLTGSHPENPTLDLGCREVFEAGQRQVVVVGPLLAEEAMAVHEGFWDRPTDAP